MASFFQRLAVRVAPGRAADIERESREWMVICPSCAHERSYWALGGVRYGAKSKGKRMRLQCPGCGARGWHRVERRAG